MSVIPTVYLAKPWTPGKPYGFPWGAPRVPMGYHRTPWVPIGPSRGTPGLIIEMFITESVQPEVRGTPDVLGTLKFFEG